MMAKPSDMTPVVDLTHGKGTGPVRYAASDLCRSAAALQPRLPGRGEHPGLARPGPGGQVSRGLGNAGARQPDAGGAWPGLLSPLRKRLQSRRAGRAGRASMPSSAFSAISRRRRAGRSRSRRRRAASGFWSSAPARAGCRPPIISRVWGTRWRFTRRDRCRAA